MDKSRIEREARKLHGELRTNSRRFWTTSPTDRQLLRPDYAVELLGITLEQLPEIKSLARANARIDIAGLIDRQANRISISLKFPDPIARFTIGHELGHWILHPNAIILHRDRPIDATIGLLDRHPMEKEADYFSASFLMPRGQVENAFGQSFGIRGPFIVNENSAFRLWPDDVEGFLERPLLDQAAVIATREKYNGVRFNSLSKYFNVSTSAMAWRLVELELVRQ